MSPPRRKHDPETLHLRIKASFNVLRVPFPEDALDAALSQAEKQRWSHLDFLMALIGPLADRRRERTVERRIREARFPEVKLLDSFDWAFNAKAIDRTQIEALATCEFIRRGENLVFIGQSGVGKSHIMQAIGRQACFLNYRVRYITSADLINDLTASLADKTLAQRLRYYARFDLLIIDEFGFDKIERAESPEASNLLYKVIDSRRQNQSTVMITNIDFDVWASYLGDPPLAMALLDRLVEHAAVLKINGKSYRAHMANRSRTQPSQS
jgi:DNA replication protein DnaC